MFLVFFSSFSSSIHTASQCPSASLAICLVSVSFPFYFSKICSVVLLAQTQKILHSDLFLIFLQLLCVRYFSIQKFSLSLVFSGFAFSWGFFAVVKNCDKLNVRGELCAAHAAATAPPPQQRGWVGATYFRQHVSRAGEKTLYFCVCLSLFSPLFQLLELFFEQFVTFTLRFFFFFFVFTSSPMGDCMHQSSL